MPRFDPVTPGEWSARTAPSSPHEGGGVHRLMTLVALGIAVTATVVAVLLFVTGGSGEPPEEALTAPDPALKARATVIACVPLTAGADSADDDRRAAAVLTGAAETQYREAASGVRRTLGARPGSRVACRVDDIGVVRHRGGEAKVLAFVTTTATTLESARPFDVEYTLVREAGDWLISDIAVLTAVENPR
ncbi:MAG: hypothetical protein QM809_03825 [Gordonia sp. (in: high G+C Gram-positive bacteria)]|uniref:hypothetical protein n=1 Tax=Gordonia sp. (in: high G+C Gram-positive bacteria) TaxID=84139 RepID=UPI0039E280C9